MHVSVAVRPALYHGNFRRQRHVEPDFAPGASVLVSLLQLFETSVRARSDCMNLRRRSIFFELPNNLAFSVS
jgi:hypothetical protein